MVIFWTIGKKIVLKGSVILQLCFCKLTKRADNLNRNLSGIQKTLNYSLNEACCENAIKWCQVKENQPVCIPPPQAKHEAGKVQEGGECGAATGWGE